MSQLDQLIVFFVRERARSIPRIDGDTCSYPTDDDDNNKGGILLPNPIVILPFPESHHREKKKEQNGSFSFHGNRAVPSSSSIINMFPHIQPKEKKSRQKLFSRKSRVRKNTRKREDVVTEL